MAARTAGANRPQRNWLPSVEMMMVTGISALDRTTANVAERDRRSLASAFARTEAIVRSHASRGLSSADAWSGAGFRSSNARILTDPHLACRVAADRVSQSVQVTERRAVRLAF